MDCMFSNERDICKSGRISPVTARMRKTAIASYQEINAKNTMRRKKTYRKIDKDQNAAGLIENQVPSHRDGAVISLVEQDA